MNKRSAILVAAGLVLSMGIGAMAVSLGLTGPTASDAAAPAGSAPIVRVERRTVTVHRKAEAPGTTTSAPVVTSRLGEGSEDEREHEEPEDELEFEYEDD